MKKLSRACIAVGTSLFLLAAPAIAEEEAESWIPGSFAGNIAFLSDYSFRGVSQTNENLAVQGGIDWSHDSGLFFGLWGSNIDFPEGDIEQDIYGGYSGAIDAFAYSAGAYFYYYPKDEDFNYWEFQLNPSYDLGVIKLTSQFLFSPEYYGVLDEGFYMKGGFVYPLPIDLGDALSLTLDSNVGYTIADDVAGAGKDDYVDWNVGLGVGLPLNLTIDLRYVATDADDADELGSIADDRFVGGIKYAF